MKKFHNLNLNPIARDVIVESSLSQESDRTHSREPTRSQVRSRSPHHRTQHQSRSRSRHSHHRRSSRSRSRSHERSRSSSHSTKDQPISRHPLTTPIRGRSLTKSNTFL